jgi:shikimate dehydrogenase
MNGGGMCVHQAVEAIRLFTGIEPDFARLHRTFAAALVARDATLGEAIASGLENRRTGL